MSEQRGAGGAAVAARRTNPGLVALAWLVVAAPLAYGVVQTVSKAAKLFTG